MLENNDIILSIYVATYNHENYIVRALDSILMQKTKYKFEVLVGEDASTDNTRTVLKAYEQQHPGVFTIFYREENMYNAEVCNSQDLRARCKGKYMIALEGDDFWLDENKIETQIDYLESHPECIAVAHNCVVVGEDSKPNGETYPECKDEKYTLRHYFSEIMPGQLTTVMYRNYLQNSSFDSSLLDKQLTPGDRLIYFSLACHGEIHCIQKAMSAYRHITTGGSSFSATSRFNYAEHLHWQAELLAYAQKHCGKYDVLCSEYLYLYVIYAGLRNKQITVKQAFCDFSALQNKISLFFVGLRRLVNKRLLHKKVYA